MDIRSAVISVKKVITFFLTLYWLSVFDHFVGLALKVLMLCENLSLLVNFRVLKSANLEENMWVF